MSGLLLAMNVGNTRTTLGLFEGATLRGRWHMATRAVRSSDEIWITLRQFLLAANVAISEHDKIAIASVVPGLTDACVQMARQRFHNEPFVVTVDKVKSLRIDYDPPTAVGADRLCGAAAAFQRFGGPVIIVDLGTATVFDVVTADAAYVGGLIAPGLLTSMESLHSGTALLPRVELKFPEQLIGRTTETSIQSGILNGSVEMIDGLVGQIQNELGSKSVVVATGGFAELVSSRSRTIAHVVPDLVLEGIRLIAEES
jgi:type III pantothenate kinase